MIYYSIDFTDFNYQENMYSIEGWGLSDSSLILDIQVFKNSKEQMDVELLYKARADVQKSFLNVPNSLDSGFRINIRNFMQVLDGLKELQIVISCADGKVKRHVISREEMIQPHREEIMLSQLDVKDIHGTKLVLAGWHVDWMEECQMSLQDEKGDVIPCEMQRVVREDVSQNLSLEDKSYEAGFDVRIPLKDIKTAKIYLVFENRILTEKIEIDVKKMCFAHSKAGRAWNVLRPAKWKENAEYILKEGFTNFVEYTKQEIDPKYTVYHSWMKRQAVTKAEIEEQKKACEEFVYRPTISIIIPLYNTPLGYLEEMIESIVTQTYSEWQLCLADGSSNDDVENFVKRKYEKDARILYKRLEKNTGISGNTNEALKMVTGEYILLADHDDLVVQGALYEIAKVLNEKPETDIIYTDEDKISMNGKLYFDPNFKSDFNIDLLHSVNYICHIFVVRKTIVDEIGGFRSAFDGAQDFDFILRCCEKSEAIYHIPKILYHWRAHPNSTAENPDSKRYAYDAGKNAVQQHYRRLGIPAEVVDTKYFGIYRTIYEVQDNPLVSIIILDQEAGNHLEQCIASVMEKSTYRNFEILVVENGDSEREYENVRTVKCEGEWNAARAYNLAVGEAKGAYCVFLDSGIEVLTPEWLEEMLGFCQRKDVGIVGCKLHNPDYSIRNAGFIAAVEDEKLYLSCRADSTEIGYNGRLISAQNISAVSADCLMVKKEVYETVDGMDEQFAGAFYDMDLCMKVRVSGRNIVFNPYAQMYHYGENCQNLEEAVEKSYFQEKWASILAAGDPYYNPNLSLETGDGSLK